MRIGGKAGLGRLRGRFAAYCFLAAFIAVAVGGAVLSVMESLAQYNHQTARHRAGAWIAVQIQVEYLRFMHALEAFAAGAPSVDHAALTERLDILWSRLPLVFDGSDGSVIRAAPGAEATIRELSDALTDIDPLVQGLRGDDGGAMEAVRGRLEPFSRRLQQLAQDIVIRQKVAGVEGELASQRQYQAVYLIGSLTLAAVLLSLVLHEMRKADVARRRLAEAIAAVPEGFALFDNQDRLVVSNERYLTICGSAGRGFRPEAGLACRPGAAEGDPTRQLDDGRWIRMQERPTSDGGHVALRIDVTDLKRREQELHLAREAAEAASRAKSAFLANMSHELRTPLNAVIGFAEVIATETMGPVGTPRYREYATDIMASGTHLLAIVNGLLDLSSIEAGHSELREEWLGLDHMVVSTRRLAAPRLGDRRFIVANSLAAGTAVHADEQQLRQVLVNLLDNAAKFTPADGEIRLSLDTRDGGLEIEVADNGIGIAAEDLERIQQPFVQVQTPFHKSHEGVGLGLAICKAMIEAHGGTLRIASRLGEGTRVTVSLPPERLASAQMKALA